MKLIAIKNVKVGDRQRKEFKPKDLQELSTSIQTKGLLHPIVLTASFTLIAGERRLRAVTELHKLGLTVNHDNQPVPLDQIPYVFIGDLSPADLLEAELEENLIRVGLTWPEQVEAIATIHRLRKELNPAQTLADTAGAVFRLSPESATSKTTLVSRALAVVNHLDDKDVLNAPNVSAAYKKVMQKSEQQLQAQLYAITSSKAKDRHTLKLGDARELISSIPDGTVDLILTDPPYGIAADKSNSSSIHHYDDSTENAQELMKLLLLEGFRITRPRAAMFVFCDTKLFGWLHAAAIAALWTPWSQPLIWNKGPGPAPWGTAGFQRAYESIFYAVKGQKELRKPGGPDIFDIARVDRNVKVHAAEKPVALLSRLIDLTCEPGSVIFDPFCGSGSVFTAADTQHCRAIGFEVNPEYHKLAAARIFQLGEPNVTDPGLSGLPTLDL